MPTTPGDHTLELPDGRRLGYAVVGDPAGEVVVNCHGGLASGHDILPADRLARARGLCIVSPDRPGIGRTDRVADFGMLRWVRGDLVGLLDHLSVERLGIMGWSEGGQYALAAAFELPHRVTRCAVIAGCPPLDDPATLRESNRVDRVLSALARRAPLALRGVAAGTHLLSRWAPGVLLRASTHGVPPDEHDAVHAEGGWFPSVLGEGSANPRGVVDEYRAAVAPWGFAPEDVTVAVRVFQGTADAMVPEAWGRRLAARIPDASLVLYPDEGHFISVTRRADVLDWLAAPR